MQRAAYCRGGLHAEVLHQKARDWFECIGRSEENLRGLQTKEMRVKADDDKERSKTPSGEF